MRALRTLYMATAAFAVVAAAPAYADDAPKGGNMTVTYQENIATLDPAIGYDWQNPAMMQAIFDGLMDYKPGTTELTPWLAKSYEISEDGKTYTFKLHHGVKFQNGRELTAEDVKYTLERLVNPETQSPGSSYFTKIKGSDEMQAGKASSLSGVRVIDKYTVEVELTEPYAPFLNVLAMHFGSIVPKEEVEKWGKDFGKHPLGSGAYRLTEWTLGQRLVFERNKDYFRNDQPHLDRIVVEVGQDPTVALLRLKRGEVDLLGDGIPPSQFESVTTDPKLKDQVVPGKQLNTSYIALNVKMKPFDNLKVREAVNMAINKERIVRIINGRGSPANQPLPPSMPGYDKGYKGYAYDPAEAKALLKEAGYGDGFTTELYAMNTDPNPRIAQAIQQDLSEVGIKVELKTLAASTVIAAGGKEDEAPMVWSGGMAWIADFPDPSGFYWPILGCGSTGPTGWNWSQYCNKDIEARAVAADRIVAPNRAKERIDKWRAIYLDIMKDAPWVPVFNEDFYTMHSKRVAGQDNYFVSKTHIPIYYEMIHETSAQQ